MYLLVGVRIAFPHRHDQHEEFGILLGDLRKNLDEVEGPIAPGILPGVRQPIVPGLEFIEDQDRGLFSKHLHHQIVAGDVRFLFAHALPFAFAPLALGMPREQNVPEVFVTLQVQALGDHAGIGAELQRAGLRVAESISPFSQPRIARSGVCAEMVECGHQVRFPLAPSPQEDDGTGVARARRFDGLQQIERWIGDLQELDGRHLQCPGLCLVCEINSSALQPSTTEFFT